MDDRRLTQPAESVFVPGRQHPAVCVLYGVQIQNWELYTLLAVAIYHFQLNLKAATALVVILYVIQTFSFFFFLGVMQ